MEAVFFQQIAAIVPAEAWCGSSSTGIGKTIHSLIMSLNVVTSGNLSNKGKKKCIESLKLLGITGMLLRGDFCSSGL